ncbi:MAG: hypothetical protein JWN86_3567 [Planctomycetota bacterium]|nr:hypothetical protein [Planctomycetota bacterium]
MNRVWALMLTMTTLVVSGCGVAAYDVRLKDTLEKLRYEAKLNSFLEKPAEGKFKELNVWLRVPKPLVEDKLALNTAPGAIDHGATFTGSPVPLAAKEGETPPVLPPMKLHVLVRQKPKKAAAKKGEPPPTVDPNVANRAAFIADVKATLAAAYGGEAATDKAPATFKANKNTFKDLKFTAASGDDIRVYFAEANKGDLEVALVFDIPPALRTNALAGSGVDYCLKSFALGNAARNLFNNGGKAAGAKDGAKTGGDAAAF